MISVCPLRLRTAFPKYSFHLGFNPSIDIFRQTSCGVINSACLSPEQSLLATYDCLLTDYYYYYYHYYYCHLVCIGYGVALNFLSRSNKSASLTA